MRHEAVQKMMLINPDFKPPTDYRYVSLLTPLTQYRVYLRFRLNLGKSGRDHYF